MNIAYKVNGLKKEVEDLKKSLGSQLDMDVIMSMTPESLVATQKAVKVVDECVELVDAFASKLDSMENKLDRIISEVKK